MHCRFRFGVRNPKHFTVTRPTKPISFRLCGGALNSSGTPSLLLKDDIIYLILEVPAHYFPNFFLFLCLFFRDSYTSV